MDVRIRQRDISDCGAACLVAVGRSYGLDLSVARVRQLAATDRKGTTLLGLVKAAQSLGFEAKGVKGPASSLSTVPLPAIAHVIVNGSLHHFIVIKSVKSKVLEIMDPADGLLHSYSWERFNEIWTGVLAIMLPGERFKLPGKRISTWSRYQTLLAPHRGLLFQCLTGAMIYTLLGLSTAIFIQKLVDNVIVESNIALLNLMSIAMLFILGLRSIIGILKNIYIAKVGQMIDAVLIIGYYRHILRLPKQFFDSMRTGEIISRVNDAVKIRLFISDAAIAVAVNISTIIFSVLLMFTYYWKLALIASAVVPFYTLIYILTNRANRSIQRKLMEKGADMEALMVETLKSSATVKYLSLEEYFGVKIENRFIDLLKPAYRSGVNNQLSAAGTEFISQLFTIVLLWTGTGYVLSRELTPGELMSFYSLVGYFTVPVMSLIAMNRLMQDASIAGDRLFEVLDLETEQSAGREMWIDKLPDGNIEFRGVTFRYASRPAVLNRIDLDIPLRKITGIVGASGSGKSTLITLLHNLYPLSEGVVRIGSYPLTQVNAAALRKMIAVVPQKTDLFTGTVLENITIGSDSADLSRVIELCENVGIMEMISSLPQGFDTAIGESGYTLSGGQKQRIAIARALYGDPEILVLDEATSSLDAVSESFIQALIRQLVSSGKTVIVIAHRLSTIRFADKIVVLDEGKVLEEGNHEQLIRNGGKYQSIWKEYLNGVDMTSEL